MYLYGGACIAIWCTAKNLKLPILTSFFAVFLTVFGQGFLQSVGEGMPHLAGYASGYFIVFLMSYLKPWEKTASWKDDVPIYAFIGIWQLSYGTAFFFIPLALCATFWRFYKNSFFDFKKLYLLLLLAVTPHLVMSLCVKMFFANSGGVAAIVFESLMKSQGGLYSLVKKYLFVLFDSFVSLGPVALIGFVGLLYASFKEKNPYLIVLSGVCSLQFLVMAVLLLPLAGRGYATFNFYPVLCLGSAFTLAKLWEMPQKLMKGCIITFCSFWVLYSNGAKFGFILPNQIFFTGLSNLDLPWWGYELHLFQ